jgi:hypothetical protein
MEIRVVATNENMIPIENGELIVEIYVNFHLIFFIDKYIYIFFKILGCCS